MALIRDFEILGTGLTVSNAYHVVTKVDIEKRLKDIPGPPDSSQPDGITADSQEEGKEVYWKAGYIGTVSIAVWKDREARESGSNAIGYVGTSASEKKHGVTVATPGEDVDIKFFLDMQSSASHIEQAYNHLLTTDYYSGSSLSV